MQVSVYFLKKSSVYEVVPRLCEKMVEAGLRVTIVSQDEEVLKNLDAVLWTYKNDSFIPHGKADEAFSERQPVLLSTSLTYVNVPQVMVYLGTDQLSDEVGDLSRIIEIVDSTCEEEMKAFHQRCKRYSKWNVTTFYENDQGGWEKQA